LITHFYPARHPSVHKPTKAETLEMRCAFRIEREKGQSS
jgi:hypothetical protein